MYRNIFSTVGKQKKRHAHRLHLLYETTTQPLLPQTLSIEWLLFLYVFLSDKVSFIFQNILTFIVAFFSMRDGRFVVQVRRLRDLSSFHFVGFMQSYLYANK